MTARNKYIGGYAVKMSAKIFASFSLEATLITAKKYEYNGFGLRTSDFGLRTSDFGLRTSDFGQGITIPKNYSSITTAILR